MRTYLRAHSVLAIVAFVLGASNTPAHGQGLLGRLEQAFIAPSNAPDQPNDPAAVKQPGSLGFVGDETPGGAGVRVVSVDAGSAAASAGIESNDTVVSVDGARIRTLDDLARSLREKHAGDTVTIDLVRKGQPKQVTVKLTSRDGTAESTLPAPRDEPAQAALGATVMPVTAELRTRYGFDRAEGAVITNIATGSAADRFHLPIGGVIVDMGGVKIQSPDDVQSFVRRSKVGDEVEVAYFIRAQRYRTKVQLGPAPLRPVVGIRPPALPNELPAGPPPTNASGSGPMIRLENLLGQDGRRPLLGRLGRVIDDIAKEPLEGAAADGNPPAGSQTPPAVAPESPPKEAQGQDDPLTLLLDEVRLLRREIELLRRRIELLEQGRQ